jgi:hypothetical protein
VSTLRVLVYNTPSERVFGQMVSYSDDGGPEYGHSIRLNRGFHGANLCTLAHELAHYICDDTYDNHEAHGKQFVAIYMHLLDKYRILPSFAFRTLAKKHRVAIAGRFKPAAIRG